MIYRIQLQLDYVYCNFASSFTFHRINSIQATASSLLSWPPTERRIIIWRLDYSNIYSIFFPCNIPLSLFHKLNQTISPSFCISFLKYSEQRFFNALLCGYPLRCGNIMLVSTTVSWISFKALKSLSRLWPTRMVLSENIVRSVACTSKIVVVTSFISSSVIPENLNVENHLLHIHVNRFIFLAVRFASNFRRCYQSL